MVQYRYLLLNGLTGQVVGEVPFTEVTYDEILSGLGTFSGKLPLEHPKATRTLLAPGSREIGVIRIDGDTETAMWNGPIIKTEASIQNNFVTVTAATPTWYLKKRVTEGIRRDYKRSKVSMVHDLFTYALGKPNGGLANFTCDDVDYGPIVQYGIGSADRRRVLQVINDLAEDPSGGFDYRVDFHWSRGSFTLSRNLSLHYPTLGADVNKWELSIPTVTDFTSTEDLDRSANAIHVVGGMHGKTALRADIRNTTNLGFGYFLLDEVYDRTSINDQAIVNSMAQDIRRLVNPAVRIYTTIFRPSSAVSPSAVPIDFADLGDTIRLNVQKGYVQFIHSRQRIVKRSVRVDNGGEETVELTFADPTDTVVV